MAGKYSCFRLFINFQHVKKEFQDERELFGIISCRVCMCLCGSWCAVLTLAISVTKITAKTTVYFINGREDHILSCPQLDKANRGGYYLMLKWKIKRVSRHNLCLSP